MKKTPPSSAGARLLDTLRSCSVAGSRKGDGKSAFPLALPLRYSRVYAINPVASGGGFHLRYEGAAGVTLSDDPQLLAVNLVRRDGSPALTEHCLVDITPQPDLPSVEEHFVASGQQVVPLVGVADLKPRDILVSSASPTPHC